MARVYAQRLGADTVNTLQYTLAMDIHAPERPIHSLREFAIHIAVVTVGILIALSLEGLREAISVHHLRRETRDTIRQEMQSDRHHSEDECRRVALYHGQLKQITAAMPALALEHPEQLQAQIVAIDNPVYFFSANGWTAALSTGVFAHMPPEEVTSYAYAAEGIKRYSELQANAVREEHEVKAYLAAYPRMNADQVSQANVKLALFSAAEEQLAFVCPQMQDDMDRALESTRR